MGPRESRWPWVLGAAFVGGAVGRVAAALARRLEGEDAPGAVEPGELRAVIDRLDPGLAAPGSASAGPAAG